LSAEILDIVHQADACFAKSAMPPDDIAQIVKKVFPEIYEKHMQAYKNSEAYISSLPRKHKKTRQKNISKRHSDVGV
jgi:hypothetical protein